MSRDPIYVARLDGQEDGWTPPAFIRRVRHAHTEDVPLDVPVVGTWHREALCALPQYRDVSFIDLPKFGRGSFRARGICARCPVREQCRAEADEAEDRTALNRLATIRAGETPSQRATRRAQPFHPAAAVAAASTSPLRPSTATAPPHCHGDGSAAASEVAGVHGSPPPSFPE